MKQLTEIVDFYGDRSAEGVHMAVAIIFEISGSSYRKVGARMIVDISGNYAGGISGGCLEKDVVKQAKLSMLKNETTVLNYDTGKNSKTVGSNLGCEGVIEVLITPIDSKKINNPIKAIRDNLDIRRPFVLWTIIESTEEERIGSCFESENLIDLELPNDELRSMEKEVLLQKNSSLISIRDTKLLAEYVSPKIQLLLIGSQRDIYPLIEISGVLGWKTTLCGSRRNYLTEYLDSVHHIEKNELGDFQIDTYTAIVFMSHDFESDIKLLPLVFDSRAFYLGTLGPEKRKKRLLSDLNRLDLMDDVNGPIGLNIGTETPEEIALSICAEIKEKYSQVHKTITAEKLIHEV